MDGVEVFNGYFRTGEVGVGNTRRFLGIPWGRVGELLGSFTSIIVIPIWYASRSAT